MQKSIIFFCNLLYNIGILEVVNMLKLFISTYNELIHLTKVNLKLTKATVSSLFL